MKFKSYFLIGTLLFLLNQQSGAAFWGNAGVGYSSDDNFYKDTYRDNNTGSFYSLNLNSGNKIAPGLRYEAAYLLSVKKNNDLKWEDNIVNSLWLNVTGRPVDVFDVCLLTFYENKNYGDENTKIYSYGQYKAGLEFPVYIFDFTTPKIGYITEGISYNDFNYDSYAVGPKCEIQQELSPWTVVTFSAVLLNRDYSEQYLYTSVTSLAASRRKDTETAVGFNVSSVITKDWNINVGIKGENVASNANFAAFDPSVAGSSSTLVDDYYSNSSPSIYMDSAFYPAAAVKCFVGVNYQEKTYAGRFATDWTSKLLAEKRKDKKVVIAVGITYRIYDPFAVRIDYTYENNASNDYVSTYTNNLVNAGINYFF